MGCPPSQVTAASSSCRSPSTKAHTACSASDAVVEALGEALTPYLAGKGTIRFPADKAIPLHVVTKSSRSGFEENAARARR